MHINNFNFHVPQHLIAQYPSVSRGESRLMILECRKRKITHDYVRNITSYLPQKIVIVGNQSRVRKARLFATSETGGHVEILCVRPLADGHANSILCTHWLCIMTKAKRQKKGRRYYLPQGMSAQLIGDDESGYKQLRFSEPLTDAYLEMHGHIPLPPYIERDDTRVDSERYQTIYADEIGSVAAPTAGLHFTHDILARMQQDERTLCYITLHVGLGTFMPVRVDNIYEHRMHTEEYEISSLISENIMNKYTLGQPIMAIGTTSLRCLESAYNVDTGILETGKNSTDIFIYPGYTFQFVSILFTNFHMPQSTLFMLVSAFAGLDFIVEAYDEAVRMEYQFFSYGDAMLILP